MRFLIFILFLSSQIYAQPYFSKIIEYGEESNPSPESLLVDNNYIYIHTLNNINSLGSSTIVKIDRTNHSSIVYPFVGFLITRDGLVKMGNNMFYGFGDNNNSEELLTFAKFSEDFGLEIEERFDNLNGAGGATACTSLNNFVYGVSVDEYENSHDEITINKIDTLGKNIWSKNYGQDEKITYCWEMNPSIDGNILVSTAVHKDLMIKSQLFKIDTSGNIIWEYEDQEGAKNGGVGHYIAPLVDGNIILKTVVDRNFDPVWNANDWYPFPPKISWISPDGELLRDTFLTSPHQNIIEAYNILPGKGNYFFGHGRWRHPETYEEYGWAFKMSSEGEMIWNRRYQHPECYQQGCFHEFVDMLEMDNGDLLLMGRASKIGEKLAIWLVKVNEHGCFGDDDCDNEVILSTGATSLPQYNVKVYPNPANDFIIISNPTTFDHYNIINLEGRIVKSGVVNEKISIKELSKGTYVIQLFDSDNIVTRKFLKM